MIPTFTDFRRFVWGCTFYLTFVILYMKFVPVDSVWIFTFSFLQPKQAATLKLKQSIA